MASWGTMSVRLIMPSHRRLGDRALRGVADLGLEDLVDHGGDDDHGAHREDDTHGSNGHVDQEKDPNAICSAKAPAEKSKRRKENLAGAAYYVAWINVSRPHYAHGTRSTTCSSSVTP